MPSPDQTKTMTPRQRVTAALAHQAVDRPPWGEIVIDDAVIADFLARPVTAWEDRREFARRLGLDIICLSPEFPAWQSTGELSLPAADQADWGDLALWTGRTTRYPFVLLDSGLGWASRCLGWQKAIMQVARPRGDLAGFLAGVEALNRELVRRARDLGALGVLLAEDIAYQQGLIMSPDQFRSLLLPSLARQVEAMRFLGLVVFFHSDGDLNAVLPDLAGIGLHGWQCLESAAGMDLAALRSRYGRSLSLWGNLDPAVLLAPESEAELTRAVQDVLAAGGGSRGGFIFGTSSGLMRGVPPRALRLVRQALQGAPRCPSD